MIPDKWTVRNQLGYQLFLNNLKVGDWVCLVSTENFDTINNTGRNHAVAGKVIMRGTKFIRIGTGVINAEFHAQGGSVRKWGNDFAIAPYDPNWVMESQVKL